MTKEEWIKIYNAKDGTWDKDDLIDKAYEIITSPIKTNYDRIKSMSVEEMAEMLIEVTEAPLSGEPFWRTPDGKLFSIWEKTKDESVEHTIQWLLQEVSEDDR